MRSAQFLSVHPFLTEALTTGDVCAIRSFQLCRQLLRHHHIAPAKWRRFPLSQNPALAGPACMVVRVTFPGPRRRVAEPPRSNGGCASRGACKFAAASGTTVAQAPILARIACGTHWLTPGSDRTPDSGGHAATTSRRRANHACCMLHIKCPRPCLRQVTRRIGIDHSSTRHDQSREVVQ